MRARFAKDTMRSRRGYIRFHILLERIKIMVVVELIRLIMKAV